MERMLFFRMLMNRSRSTLRRTRALRDLEDLEYHVYPAEEVHAVFRDGYTKKINVGCDSGLAMIRDIVNHIEL